jgi:hypothetical protein
MNAGGGGVGNDKYMALEENQMKRLNQLQMRVKEQET